jgi:hypothetical protein
VGDLLTDYILPHSTAHFLHASAHFLQQSCVECFPHSAAQALQTSAQSLHSASQNDESLAANLAHKAQMSAQSRHSAIHFKWSLLFMLMQQVAQSSHSIAHARQASMQFLDFFTLFNTFLYSFLQFRCCPAFRFAITRFIVLCCPSASIHHSSSHCSAAEAQEKHDDDKRHDERCIGFCAHKIILLCDTHRAQKLVVLLIAKWFCYSSFTMLIQSEENSKIALIATTRRWSSRQRRAGTRNVCTSKLQVAY